MDEKPITDKKDHNLSGRPYSDKMFADPKFNNRTFESLIKPATDNAKAVFDVHKMFLNFSDNITKTYAETFAFQTGLFRKLIENHNNGDIYNKAAGLTQDQKNRQKIFFTREMCMEFATGSAGSVLGPEFEIIDTYKTRVRLPDEPLMLVDRIISVKGEKGSLGSGRVVTEHDVLHDSWYMDGGRAPVFISVEAGQADLFLCSYLGIDFAVKGKRTYRLLDATVEFHRGLPKPGDVIRYDIKIKRFVRQDDTYLFFFDFDGYIGNDNLITMTNGIAGFFTKEEVNNSGGIILTNDETESKTGKKCPDWKELVPLCSESYDDKGVNALRNGDLAGCFGPGFKGIKLDKSLWLPGGRLKLINRILSIEPEGGRYKIGSIRAEADIHPDDWFLTCHFMDDMVMPGTLMYECCCHTLRVFIMRIGWVTAKPGVCFEPVAGVKAKLKCRGPVTPDTKHVVYEVEIKETGYMPEPYVIADAHMYADGRHIVMFKNMSIKMSNISRNEIEAVWAEKKRKHPIVDYDPELTSDTTSVNKEVLFDRSHILTFATGKPSRAFGEPYKKFDEERFIARLPRPPYSFIDRITKVEPKPWVLKPDGWIEAEHDVSRKAWYFSADCSFSVPFCVLLEIALQPCGWLAAYMGSALLSEKNLRFRNLEGNAVLYRDVMQKKSTLTVRTRMKQSSAAGDMIIEEFEFHILQSKTTIYKGSTTFGFFTNNALGNQVGISNAEKDAYRATQDELKKSKSCIFEDKAPFTPDDTNNLDHTNFAPPYMAMPSNALRMIDEIDIYIPDGGPSGLGFIRGVKKVNPDEWFFKAHFFQDPVCPGSLGMESFLQLIKFMALERWGHLANTHRFELLKEKPHNWIYRGQIVPENNKIEVEAAVTKIEDSPAFIIQADGYLKVDGLYIYEMKGFGIKLVPVR